MGKEEGPCDECGRTSSMLDLPYPYGRCPRCASRKDGRRILVEPGADGFPPLLLIPGRRVRNADVARMSDTFREAQRDRRPIVIDGSTAVFQLADGVYQRLE